MMSVIALSAPEMIILRKVLKSRLIANFVGVVSVGILLVLLLSIFVLLSPLARAADRPDFLADADWLAKRIKDPKLVVLEVRYHPHRHYTVGHIPGTVLIDARPRDMYDGSRIQHATQGGHIPGAINIVSLDGVDGQSQQRKSLADLQQFYKDVPKDALVITYCHDGFRSTLTWLQLKALGYRNVSVYNGPRT